MAQQEAAKALANLMSKVARYSVLLGVGGSAVQASLYTGEGSSSSSSRTSHASHPITQRWGSSRP